MVADKTVRDRPTEKQAEALLEALVGDIDIGEQQVAPKSPHALTHLEAALGRGQVLYPYMLDRLAAPGSIVTRKYRGDGSSKIWVEANAELDAFEAKRDATLDYLQGCVDALRPEPSSEVGVKGLRAKFRAACDLLGSYVEEHDAGVAAANPGEQACPCELCGKAQELLLHENEGGDPR